MKSKNKKRQIDFQIIARWVGEGDRVLDLGCGRGVLLEYLKQKKAVYGVGVDINLDYILSCVKRGVTAYHGDIRKLLATFDDDTFDRVIFSRAVEFVEDPKSILAEGLRVGKRATVGFANHGFWRNRLNFFLEGRLEINDLKQRPWYERQGSNPFSVNEFNDFCDKQKMEIKNRVYLSGNFESECSALPNLFASYAIYDLAKK